MVTNNTSVVISFWVEKNIDKSKLEDNTNFNCSVIRVKAQA